MSTQQNSPANASAIADLDSVQTWSPLRVWPVVPMLAGMLLRDSCFDSRGRTFAAVGDCRIWSFIDEFCSWRSGGCPPPLANDSNGSLASSVSPSPLASRSQPFNPTMMGPAITVYMIPVGMASFGICAILARECVQRSELGSRYLPQGWGLGSAGYFYAHRRACGVTMRWD